jgi:putative DNA methylase
MDERVQTLKDWMAREERGTVWIARNVGRTALEQVLGMSDAAAGALEEDARLTALFLWTLQSTEARNGDNGNGRKAASDEADEDDEEAVATLAAKGLSLPFDVVRRFAQPLGIGLPAWEKRVIEISKGVVRLLPVAKRARALFGDEGASAVADWIERDPGGNLQQVLFPELEAVPKTRRRGGGRKPIVDTDAEIQSLDATTLDRVHVAMLLQAGGRANALRNLIQSEQERGPGFLRLVNALSALYPRRSEEKRLLDAMLLAVPR